MTTEQLLVNTGMVASITLTTDEATTDADGTVTVTKTNLAGTSTSASATHSGSAGSGIYTLTIAPVATPDILTLSWACTISGIATTVTSRIEVVGGYHFTIYDLRASDASLSSTANYPMSALVEARASAERDVERIIGYALVPRATVETIIPNESGDLAASWGRVRSLRTATVSGSSASVTGLTIQGNRVVGGAFDDDYPVTLTYEHGLDYAPHDLARASMALARIRAMAVNSGVPDRAERYVSENGRTFVLSSPTAGRVGVPEIDAVLGRYRTPGIA